MERSVKVIDVSVESGKVSVGNGKVSVKMGRSRYLKWFQVPVRWIHFSHFNCSNSQRPNINLIVIWWISDYFRGLFSVINVAMETGFFRGCDTRIILNGYKKDVRKWSYHPVGSTNHCFCFGGIGIKFSRNSKISNFSFSFRCQ